MSIEVCRRIILACGLIASPGLHSHSLTQSSGPPLPKSHRHIGVDKSEVGDVIPDLLDGRNFARGRHEERESYTEPQDGI